MPSVMEAAMNIAEASSSLAPCSLLKWLEDKIQISRGILQMRINVMELGRFTAAQQLSRRRPERDSIILHAAGERNKGKGSLCTEILKRFCAENPRQLFWCGRSRGAGLRLLGDDLIFDFVVRGLGNNFLLHEVKLRAIGTAGNDLLRVGVSNSRQGLELIGSRRIDVELIGRGGRLHRIQLGNGSGFPCVLRKRSRLHDR